MGVGFIIGKSFSGHAEEPVNSIIEQTKNTEKYPLINPTALSNLNKHFIINFQPLRAELESIQKSSGSRTSIYFAYLNNAAWVGLDERQLFTAASTVKVPLAMSILKSVEEGKLNLDDQYTLEQLDLNNSFGELYKIGPNKTLKISDLLKIMLENSDNTAANALNSVLLRLGIEDPLANVYNFMGWEFNTFGETPNYSKIHLKVLSNMFLALYNATYVNHEHSNLILSHLSHSKFKNKIAAGVPNEITVSNKIGVVNNEKIYSDCGIIYAPNRHYLLCVATEGVDEMTAADLMKRISETVYKYVINH